MDEPTAMRPRIHFSASVTCSAASEEEAARINSIYIYIYIYISAQASVRAAHFSNEIGVVSSGAVYFQTGAGGVKSAHTEHPKSILVKRY